jgi:hypothetical protein
MRNLLISRTAAVLAGTALALSISSVASAAPASANQWQQFGGWYSTQASCIAVGRDYVHSNGATGFTCDPLNGEYVLWVIYP